MPASSRPDGRLRAAIADVPADRRYLLEHLADWADMPERDGLVKLTSYRGKRGIVTLAPPGQRQYRTGKHLQRH
jgi:hypothetical protein